MIEMTRNKSVVIYVLLMIAVVLGIDVLFFRNRFWERLAANIGIVLVFTAFYFRFLRNSYIKPRHRLVAKTVRGKPATKFGA